MEDGLYYIQSLCILSITICISTIVSQETTTKDRIYPLPAGTPPPPLTIESEVIGPFRIWHIVGFCAAGILILVIVVCCCVDVRIPRSKEEIEESYQKRILNKKYTKEMSDPFAPEPPRTLPKPSPAPKRHPNRIPATNPSFSPDDPEIIFASEPPRKSKSMNYGNKSRSAGFRGDHENATSNGFVTRNPSAVSDRNEYQIRPAERLARAVSSVSNLSRKRDFYTGQQQQLRQGNGSANLDNTQNYQRERLAHQSSRAQDHEALARKQRELRNRLLAQGYDLDGNDPTRAPANLSKAKRFGIQTPLANHPSAVLGPTRNTREGHPSLASTARTLAAMSPHPGHIARQ